MGRFTVQEAQAWLEKTKLTITSLDGDLSTHVEQEALGKLSRVYDTSGWTNTGNTPNLVRSIMSAMYACRFYTRQYSEDQDDENYGTRLCEYASTLLQGVIDGIIDLVDVPGVVGALSGPVFYPTDGSSALEPTPDDRSLGPEKFSMGTVW